MTTAGRADGRRATLVGAFVALLLVLGIHLGSRGFRDFDTALVPYAAASVFSAFGLGYRYAMWLRRPPTALYWRRGWQHFCSPRNLPSNIARATRLVWDNLLAQRFIERRSHLRWAAHAGIFWGCILAALVTFPLSFGWIRFETPASGSQANYDAFFFGLRVFGFRIEGPLAPLVFNILDVSAVLVLAGVALALWRRVRDRGAIALQQIANDLLPLILLFAIATTGIGLTISAHWLRGFHYTFLSQFHAITVIFTLLYLPFGKFFHLFQRPAQLSIDFYRRAGAAGSHASCARCGAVFASALQIADLKQVQRELSIRFALDGGGHYQDVCPPCRRKNLALLQDAMWSGARSERG